jgi:hypothetical protein
VLDVGVEGSGVTCEGELFLPLPILDGLLASNRFARPVGFGLGIVMGLRWREKYDANLLDDADEDVLDAVELVFEPNMSAPRAAREREAKRRTCVHKD